MGALSAHLSQGIYKLFVLDFPQIEKLAVCKNDFVVLSNSLDVLNIVPKRKKKYLFF